jgi:O-antigen/teichoic acid export membrane protein
MVLFREDLLGLFGNDFSKAAIPLVILTAGQLVNAACGPVGTLFVMTSQTRYAATGFAIAAATTSLLLFMLVPVWDVIGASLATAVGIATLNLVLVFFAWSRNRTDPTIVGRSWRDHA